MRRYQPERSAELFWDGNQICALAGRNLGEHFAESAFRGVGDFGIWLVQWKRKRLQRHLKQLMTLQFDQSKSPMPMLRE
jgi:hypothetical protein